MGHILQNIKRRLMLGGSKSRAPTAGTQQPQPAVTATDPLPPPGLASPVTWSSLQQRSGQNSADTKQTPPMKSPRRRIPLGTLPAELAALEQQFASLPLHRPPSKEQLQSRLLAARPPSQAQEKAQSTAGSKSVSSKHFQRVAKSTSSVRSVGGEASKPAATGWRARARGRADAKLQTPVAGNAAVRSHTASEEQQQLAALPTSSSRPLSAAPQSSAPHKAAHSSSTSWQAAKRLHKAEADEPLLSAAGRGGMWQESNTAPVMSTAVTEACQLKAASETSRGGRTSFEVSSSGSSSSSSSELNLRLDPRAGAGGATGLMPSSISQPSGPPEQPHGRRPTPAAASIPQTAHESSTLLPQTSPRSELPPDLLSLRESVARAQRGRATGTPLCTRRAASVQEEAAARVRTASGDGSTGLEPSPLPRPPATAGANLSAKAAASSLPQQPRPGELSRGTKKLAALRRQRRSDWLSDFGGSSPGCQRSQDEETPSLPLSLAAVAESRPASTAPLSPAAKGQRSRLSIGRPVSSKPEAGEASSDTKPTAALTGSAGRQAGLEQVAHAPRPPGVTQAQLRQQEAWGSLAGLSLEAVLRQGPNDGQQGAAAGAAQGRENSGAQSNSCSPTGNAGSPTPSSPARVQLKGLHPQQSPRQCRRMTVPHASFVESMDRLAALHRARSDSEQPSIGIQWKLPPSMRRSNGSLGRRLPPLPSSHGADGSPGQLRETRLPAGGGHLAKSRCRGASPLHSAQAAARPAVPQPQLKEAAVGAEWDAAAADMLPHGPPPPLHAPGMQPQQLQQDHQQQQQQQQQQRPTFSGPPEQLPRLENQRSSPPHMLQYMSQYQAQPGLHPGIQQAAQHSLQAGPQTQPPLWWQQQQHAAYMHAQRQYAAHLAQQGQHLVHHHGQQQQRLMSQNSLPLQSGSGRRKWQSFETGLAGQPLHVADPRTGFAQHASPWPHQLPLQNPQGQAPQWFQQQHPHQRQQRHSGTYAPAFVTHAGLQRFHSGGLLPSASGYTAGMQQHPGGTGMAVRGHSFIQVPSTLSSAAHS